VTRIDFQTFRKSVEIAAIERQNVRHERWSGESLFFADGTL